MKIFKNDNKIKYFEIKIFILIKFNIKNSIEIIDNVNRNYKLINMNAYLL